MQCFYCARKDSGFHCSLCNHAVYCGIDCQLNDWQRHKPLCSKDAAPTQPFEESKPLIDQFEQQITIGEGNFSQIREVIYTPNNTIYALKIIDISKATHNHREPDILMEKYCLNLFAGEYDIVKQFATFKSASCACILMEYVRGKELWEQCKSFGLCSEALCRYYFHLILNAVSTVHKHGIVHRDLKTENILLTSDNIHIKLIDFGCALDINHPEARPKAKLWSKKDFEHFTGTPQFMAPENIRNKNSSLKSDIWSLGCILYQLYVGLSPYHAASDYLSMKKAVEEEIQIPGFIPEDHRKLISLLLIKDPDKRPNITDIPNQKVKYPYLSLKDVAMISYKKMLLNESPVWKVNHSKMEDEISKWKQCLIFHQPFLKSDEYVLLSSKLQRIELQLKCLVEETELCINSVNKQ